MKLKDNHIILIGICCILIFLLVRINTEKPIEFFTDESVPYGDLLIDRNGNNLSIYNFEFNSNKMDLLSTSNGINGLENFEIVVNVNHPKRLESLHIENIPNFQLFTRNSIDEEYILKNEYQNQSNGLLNNIMDSYGKKIIATSLKIVGVTKSNNVKFELYGANENTSQKITMLNGSVLQTTMNVNDETVSQLKTNSDDYLNVIMPSNDDHLVYYLKFKTNCESVKLFYKHLGENTTYKLPCKDEVYNTLNSLEHDNYLYLPHPTLIRSLQLAPLTNFNKDEIITNVQVYGKVVQNKEKYIDQSRFFCNREANQNIPIIEEFSDSRLLSSFSDTEKLCEALEYQENIKAEKLKIEKNKVYMLKLLEQEKEINDLIGLINKLKDAKDKRTEKDDVLKLALYEQQKQDEAKVTDLAQDRLNNQKNLELNLNLQPYSE